MRANTHNLYTCKPELPMLKILFTLLLATAATPALAVKGNVEDAREAWTLIAAGALVVDVRTPEEFEKGHIEGAVNLPYDQTDRFIDTLGDDRDRSIVLYCGSGRRAGIAQEALEEMGFTRVFNASGYEALEATQP